MNAQTQTYSPVTLSNFHDWDYERWSAKKDAIDDAIDGRLDDLQSSSFQYAKDTVESAVERIADNAKGEQERLNRYLLQVWQYRNAKPDTTERKLRDYAVSVIADIMNSALVDAVTADTQKQY